MKGRACRAASGSTAAAISKLPYGPSCSRWRRSTRAACRWTPASTRITATSWAAGVPALTLWVHPGEYDTHHHAITDTIDKVDRRTLAIDTAVMAVATLAL